MIAHEPLDCDYCGGPAPLVDSAIVYGGRSYGPIYYCHPCRAWVGCHKGTTRPLGRLADAELRRAKQRAHRAFDPLWRGTAGARRKAYRWLAQQLGISESQCHIGMFDVTMCARVVEACSSRGNEVSFQRRPGRRTTSDTTTGDSECSVS